MATPDRQLIGALVAIEAPVGAYPDIAAALPDQPGLFAVHGTDSVWTALGLGTNPDGRPLHIAAAPHSLARRDTRWAFSTGKTGNSSTRRAFAAMLQDTLNLHAQPRNLDRPATPGQFALEAEADERLTAWMTTALRIAWWVAPDHVDTHQIWQSAVSMSGPPLNAQHSFSPWRLAVRTRREALIEEARNYQPRASAKD